MQTRDELIDHYHKLTLQYTVREVVELMVDRMMLERILGRLDQIEQEHTR